MRRNPSANGSESENPLLSPRLPDDAVASPPVSAAPNPVFPRSRSPIRLPMQAAVPPPAEEGSIPMASKQDVISTIRVLCDQQNAMMESFQHQVSQIREAQETFEVVHKRRWAQDEQKRTLERTIQEQERTIQEQKSMIAARQKIIEERQSAIEVFNKAKEAKSSQSQEVEGLKDVVMAFINGMNSRFQVLEDRIKALEHTNRG
ncbi:hypothetical protein ACHAPT_013319 [Fusarium lateritium]